MRLPLLLALSVVLAPVLVADAAATGAAPASLETAFAHPPDEARPWVFWFWADGNVTREGITADLEAMKRVGIGGVAFMEVDQNVPRGPVRFLSPQWRDLFAFAVAESTRLGLQFDLNNDAGWTGSGGPWVDGEHSMQRVVWTEKRLTGPVHHEGALEQPETVAGFYRDIAVLAFPTSEAAARVDKAATKSGLGLIASSVRVESGPAGIDRTHVVDLTPNLRHGTLRWDVPPGDWTILRIGHTSTGKTNYPAVKEGEGLDVDKLDRNAFDRHYDAFVGQMLQLTAGTKAGPTAGLNTVHIDSWEVGYQNWTPSFRAEFQRRRGYDPVPWLPVFAGHVVDHQALSERFLWDVRRTISELVNDNYGARMAERAHADGRQFTLEAYRNGPFDCVSFGGRADIPVGEFWLTRDPANLHPSVKTMSSVGHVYGRPVIGAEAFTASDTMGRQRNHPYSLKAIGDAAFCAGINHFIFHRYAMQPWTDDRKPGMTMGPWGVEYERTATWWEQTRPWHEYVSRCGYLLRQGRFVADFCYLQSEEGINNPTLTTVLEPALPLGYDFDFCSDEVVRTRMTVVNGRLTLPDGMSYRVLVLPTQRLMRPELLRRIRDLVREGAVVFGAPPLQSPSLAGYPVCDQDVADLARELWGENPGAVVDRTVGKGRVLWASALADVVPKLDLPPDFAWRQAERARTTTSDVPVIRSIHRVLEDREVYFVANLSAFPAQIVTSLRVADGQPELWQAEDGSRVPAPVYRFADGRLRLPLELDPRGSVFVVVKRSTTSPIHAELIERNGVTIAETGPVPLQAITPTPLSVPKLADTFTMAAWVNPNAETALPVESIRGSNAYSVERNDVLFPPPVHELLNDPGVAGAGFAVGRDGVTVLEHGDHHFPATLVYKAPLKGWTHVAVVFDHGTPELYLDAKRVATGRKSGLKIYSGVDVTHGREIEPFRGQYSKVQQFDHALSEAEIGDLMRRTPRDPVKPPPEPASLTVFDPTGIRASGNTIGLYESGTYTSRLSDGSTRAVTVSELPSPLAVVGPWILRFPTHWGAPPQVPLSRLMSWSDHPDAGVRHFSGTATYAKTVEVPNAFVAAGRRVWLDLGDVQVVAEVRVNDHAIGTLWKPPFRMDITDAVKAGENAVEVKVTNLWVNRLIGDEQLPSDREWTKVPKRGGWALLEYPEWFKRGERSPTGRFTFATWRHYEKNAPLLPSGLLGPVMLRCEAVLPANGLSAHESSSAR